MRDERKTRGQLVKELEELRGRVAQLEASETERQRAEEALRFARFAIQQLERDIGEWMQREEVRREGEERYRRIVETAYEGIWIMDAEARTTFANRRMADMLGYSVEEMMGRPLLAFMDQEWKDVAQALLGRRRRGAVEQHDFQFRRKDGSELWAIVRTNPLFDGEGRYAGALEMITDITERRRAEETLAQEQHLLTALMDHVPDNIYFKDAASRFVRINKALAGYFGLDDPAQAVGQTDFGFFTEEHARQAHADEEEVMKTGHPLVGKEEKETWPDGRETWVSTTKMALRDRGGRIIGTFGISRDITERKEAEEALRESEERYRNVVERANDAICIIREGVVEYANLRLAEIWGGTVEEVLGTPFTNYVHSDELARVVDRYQRRMAGQPVAPIYETVLRRKDGSKVDAEINAGVITYQGRPADLVIVRDITERKRRERLLRTLNEAALAVERALTPEEIFAALSGALEKLGFSCALFRTDESRSGLFLTDFSYGVAEVKALEGLTGVKMRDLVIPVEDVAVLREVVCERQTLFVEDTEGIVRQLAPGPVKKLAASIVRMLNMPRAIAAPLVVEDEVIGVLSVQSDDLRAEDVPAITAFAHQMGAAWRKANLLQELRDSLAELQHTQALLVQAQKMEAVGRLAGGVAHDFNNLLTAIMGFGQLVLSGLAPDDPLRLDAQEILLASDRATSLTHQLLAFSRRQTLQPQVLDLNALVADTEKMLRRLIGEDIELVTLLEPGLVRVRVDPGQVSQVIINMAVNAGDAMPRGGPADHQDGAGDGGREALRPHASGAAGEVRLSLYRRHRGGDG